MLLSQCRPVTSIEVTERYIFVCEGPGISIFDKNGIQIHQAVIAPLHKTIFGSSVYYKKETHHDKYFIFAYGQNFFRLVCFDANSQEIFSVISDADRGCGEIFSDSSYIAARWLNDGRKLAAITDENILHVFDLSSEAQKDVNSSNFRIKRRTTRGVPTTLFSATLSGSTEDDLIVFSGTNLSSVYVWAPQDAMANYHLLVEGIKGSVLSLKFNELTNVLLASSDQRSVFAWKFATKSVENMSHNHHFEKLKPFSLIQNEVQVFLISEMAGHTGRVWNVDVWEDKIISAGQDSNLLLWDSCGKLLNVFSGSSVMSIRCCRFDPWKNVVYTGADDGSVCQWNLSNSLSTKTIPVQLKGGQKNHDEICVNKGSTSYPRQVLTYNSNHFLVSKSSGQFILTDLEGNTGVVYENKQFEHYSVCALSSDKNMLAIGSKHGSLHLVELVLSSRQNNPNFSSDKGFKSAFNSNPLDLEGKCCHQKLLDSKIVNIHWLNDGTTLVVSTCTKIIFILRDHIEHDSDYENCKPVQWLKQFQFTIDWKDKPGVAAAIKIVPTTDSDSYAVVGDEYGSLHIFRLGQKTEQPLHTKVKVHGMYGVCDLRHGCESSEFWSVGRNRSVIHFKLSFERDEEPVLLVLEVVESCLNWNARLHFSDVGSLLCGFLENDFVILDLKEDRIVKKVPCGGAHRSWDVLFCKDRVTFGFIRHKELTVTQFGLDSKNIKLGLFGGKTINVITTCPFFGNIGPERSNCQGFCIITGGEDGVLRLTSTFLKVSNSSPSDGVSCCKLAKFKYHASSVRVIKCVQLLEDSLLVLSAGGRSQIIASIIRRNGTAGSIVWNKASSISLPQSRMTEEEPDFSDSDMRVMDISVESLSGNSAKTGQYTFLLLCACSDGFPRLVNLSLVLNQNQKHPFEKSKFTLINTFALQSPMDPKSGSIQHAVSRVSIFSIPSESKSRVTAVCANSVGELIMFSFASNSDLRSETTTTTKRKNEERISSNMLDVKEYVLEKIQKSAITAMDALNITTESESGIQTKHLVVTGSDDGTVALYLVTICLCENTETSSKITVEELWENRIHHSAAVNAVSILESRIIVAASADQVVTLRSVDGIKLQWFRCGVMDVQDMTVVQAASFSQKQCLDLAGQSSDGVTAPLTTNFVILLVGQGFEIRRIIF